MSAHTPGPWKHVPWHVEEGNPAVRAPEGWLICETSSDDNARLIAAAPDLLNALTVLAGACESMGIPVDAARAAIAKATGGQP